MRSKTAQFLSLENPGRQYIEDRRKLSRSEPILVSIRPFGLVGSVGNGTDSDQTNLDARSNALLCAL
jgi:hypothetical protein